MSEEELPEGWVECTMGDIADVVGGGTPKASDPANFAARGHPWITPADLSRFRDVYIQRGSRDLSDQGLRTSSARMVPVGTVLMSSRAPIGYLAIAAGPVSTNQGFRSFICRPGVLPGFVYYWLMFSRTIIEDMGSGSTFNEISGSRCREIPFRFAPPAEQKRIVAKVEELLARVNAAHERLARVPAILKRFRQAVLAAACKGALTAGWRGRQRPEPAWATWRAAEVCEKVQSGGTPREGFVTAPGIPFIKIYNIVDQRINFEYRPQFVTKSIHSGSLAKSRVLPGDVLMNIVGPPLGKVAIVPDNFPEWNINQAITLFRPSKAVTTGWLYIVLCSGTNVKLIDPETRGSAGQQNISLSQCRDFEIPVPEVKEQREIVRRVEALFKLADAIEKRVATATARAEKLTQAILAKAFRGELVPTEAELARREGRAYERAEDLLERVRQAATGEPARIIGRKKRAARK